MARWVVGAGVAAWVALIGAAPALAEGAVALGLPKDVAAEGLSTGMSSDYPRGSAGRVALRMCRNIPDSPESRRRLCRVVAVFQGRCAAVAMDPRDGTPGWGWGLGATRKQAEAVALAGCRKTAGPDRQAACTISLQQCDG